jgi:hypothetical protein
MSSPPKETGGKWDPENLIEHKVDEKSEEDGDH